MSLLCVLNNPSLTYTSNVPSSYLYPSDIAASLTLTSNLHSPYLYPSDIIAAKYTVESEQQCELRFLRARGFDVVKALVLLSECNQKLTEMRAAHWANCDPDTALSCDTAALRNFYPHIQAGFDKFNRPILFEHTGGMNPNAVLQMTSKQGLINYHFWCMETSLDQKFTEAANRAESTHDNPDGTTIHNISTCVVLDFKDLGMQHVAQKMLDQMKMFIGKIPLV